MTDRKKWIVGLDFRPSSQGALRWALWLDRHSVADGERLVGIHVLEESSLQAALQHHHLDEVLTSANQAAARVIEETGGKDRMSEVHVLQGGAAESSLSTACTYHGADGVILGRQALREGRYLNRLGRVARRVLRWLTSPVIIVPPDLQPSEDPQAPVLAACNLDDDSVNAVTFAADMAKRLNRPLVLVHTVPLPDDYGARILSPQALAQLKDEHQQTGETALSRWAEEHGFTDAKYEVRQGGVVESLVKAAEDSHAALLVTGSRHLSNFERWFLTSVGTEVASLAPCAVAVVPPVDMPHQPPLTR